MFTVGVQVIISNRNWCFFATNKTEKGGTEFLDLVQMSAIRIVRHTKIRGMANPYDIRWQGYFSKRWIESRIYIPISLFRSPPKYRRFHHSWRFLKRETM